MALCVAVVDAISEDVYVVVTVSVTPVGNVVILGVEVLTMEGDAARDPVAVAHRDTGGERLDDCDLEIAADLVSVFDIRAVGLFLPLDDTVVEDDCDLVSLAEDVYETEALVVLELLVEPVPVGEAALLFDEAGLAVAEFVALSTAELVALLVSLTLEPVVTLSDTKGVSVLIPAEEVVIVFVVRSVNEPLLVADDEVETLLVFVCVAELVTVFVPGGVRVSLIEAVPHDDAVEVFEEDVDLENVGDAELLFVCRTEAVVVRVERVDPLIVVLPVDVLELETLRVPLGDAVAVFEEDIDGVPVTETRVVVEPRVVFVNEGDAEEVFDGASVLVGDVLAVLVLEGCVDLVEQELAEAVFELDTEPVPVFVGAVERVDVVDPVAVLEDVRDCVPRDVALAVRETVVLRVVVWVDVTVFVEVLLPVPGSVGRVDFVAVVVRVDVFDIVGDRDGRTRFTESCRSTKPLEFVQGLATMVPKVNRSNGKRIVHLLVLYMI